MRKAEKRARGEAKAKQEAADRLASGLAAQKADQARRRNVEARYGQEAQSVNQRRRSIFVKNGINPDTGVVFTNDEMAELEKAANTPEHRRLVERIKAGRAGILNEQPPLGGIDDYLDPMDRLMGMTVGEFRGNMDKLVGALFGPANWIMPTEEVKKEKKAAPRFITRSED